MNKESWQEKSWEKLLAKIWDKRARDVNIVKYTKSDLDPILSKYTKSGQGEIRIFNSVSPKIEALNKRDLIKLPMTRGSWVVLKKASKITFVEPADGGIFETKIKITDGMHSGIVDTLKLKSNPGETTLLAIANHTGIISDFYGLKEIGTLFTGGRQKAGVHLIVGSNSIDMSKAQIEIDGGFEWPENIVIVEMKSSFKQNNFDVNQALIPLLKWENLLKDKKVHSLVMLAQTNLDGIEYWVYDFVRDTSKSSIGMKIDKSKKYIIKI